MDLLGGYTSPSEDEKDDTMGEARQEESATQEEEETKMTSSFLPSAEDVFSEGAPGDKRRVISHESASGKRIMTSHPSAKPSAPAKPALFLPPQMKRPNVSTEDVEYVNTAAMDTLLL